MRAFLDGVLSLILVLIAGWFFMYLVFGIDLKVKFAWAPNPNAGTVAAIPTVPDTIGVCGKPISDPSNPNRWGLHGNWWLMDRVRPGNDRLCVREGRAYWESEL
jgi:hypothetical protein